MFQIITTKEIADIFPRTYFVAKKMKYIPLLYSCKSNWKSMFTGDSRIPFLKMSKNLLEIKLYYQNIVL